MRSLRVCRVIEKLANYDGDRLRNGTVLISKNRNNVYRLSRMSENYCLAVVFGGCIGDAIIFADALVDIAAMRGDPFERLMLVCKPAVARFIVVAHPELEAIVREFDLGKYTTNRRYRKSQADLIAQLRKCVVVNPHPSKYAEAVSLISKSSIRVDLRERTYARPSSFGYWLNKIAYTDHIMVPSGSMAYERYKVLLDWFGVENYQSSIKSFPENPRSAPEIAGPYCVVAPTANEPEKSWEIEKFVDVLRWILESTSLSICLCGGAEGKGLYAKMVPGMRGFEDRIVDLMGSTSFAQWIELVRHAEFCFGNDSATVHIAAHVGTPSVCVTPGFSYGYVQPYVLDEVDASTPIPLCLYAYKDCFGCYLKDFKRCSGNPACKNEIKAGRPYLCIQDITVGQAISALISLIGSLEL